MTTRTTFTPAGSESAVGPETSTTSAPRRAATFARANPIFPEEGLEMNRTGSIGSRVGPAVTTTRRPEKSLWPSKREAARAMSAGSESRPKPTSPSASSPEAGPHTCMPLARSAARFSCVTEFCHMRVFMAGARSTGLVAASTALVTASFAMPARIRARRSAVAGATIRRLAMRAISRWP